MRVLVEKNGAVLVENLEVAETFFRRFLGLMGRAALGPEQGLLLRPCSSIHMFFMRFPIDAIFIDEDGRIVGIEHGLRPWRVSRIYSKARAVLEIESGRAGKACLEKGDRLLFLN